MIGIAGNKGEREMSKVILDLIDLNLSLQGMIIDPAINVSDLTTDEKLELYEKLFSTKVELVR
jgi:hypothetical protein